MFFQKSGFVCLFLISITPAKYYNFDNSNKKCHINIVLIEYFAADCEADKKKSIY